MKSSVNTVTLVLFLSLMAGLLFITTEKSNAQILELDQKIFGMDCAPCAKGVENRMKRLNGVQKAELDLNSGEARLVFSGSLDTYLQQLQLSIIDGWYYPIKASINIKVLDHHI